MSLDVETTYDGDADAGYIAFGEIAHGAAVKQTFVDAPELRGRGDIVLDFDAHGRLLGIELIGVRGLLGRAIGER